MSGPGPGRIGPPDRRPRSLSGSVRDRRRTPRNAGHFFIPPPTWLFQSQDDRYFMGTSNEFFLVASMGRWQFGGVKAFSGRPHLCSCNATDMAYAIIININPRLHLLFRHPRPHRGGGYLSPPPARLPPNCNRASRQRRMESSRCSESNRIRCYYFSPRLTGVFL